MLAELLHSVEFQFVAPPLIFLVFHVTLHLVSRRTSSAAVWHALNAGIHFAVIAASIQWAAALYYGKLISDPAGLGMHQESIAAAWSVSMMMMPVTLIAGVVVALIDGWIHSRHMEAQGGGSRRRQLTWKAAMIVFPNLAGLILFGVVVGNILGVGVMPSVH